MFGHFYIHSSGQMKKDAVTFYGMGTGQIHLDDVKCDGDETNIGECQHKFWGDNDCLHKEDVGCICKTASGTGNHVILLLPPAQKMVILLTGTKWKLRNLGHQPPIGLQASRKG